MAAPMTEQLKPPKVDSTLSKGLAILENLAHAPGSKGVTALSKELGLTKSNTFRLLQTLKVLGYVRHLDDKSYAATLRMWQVGRTTVDSLNLRELAAPEMAYLSEQTEETIYLAVAMDLEIVYIDKIESRKPIRSWNPIGGSAPIHAVGTGKAILAANYPTLREKLRDNLARHTSQTLTSLERLDEEVATTRSRGYAFDRGEFRDRVLSFGAPILLGDEAVAAIGISLPDVSLPHAGEDRLGALVQHAAAAISRKLNRL